MKKIGILASLALCVTIGGVYAAWVYADQEVKTSYATMGVTVTGVTGSSQKGVLGAVGTNVSLTIDDVDNAKQHITELVYDPNGYFTVTFTANANAPQDVLKNGIALEWYLGLATTANVAVENVSTVTYNDMGVDKAIYELEKDHVAIQRLHSDDWAVDTEKDGITKKTIENGVQYVNANDVVVESRVEKPNGTVVFTYRVEVQDVVQKITLTEILLDTQEKHNAYSAEVNKYLFHFHVAEVVAQSSSN